MLQQELEDRLLLWLARWPREGVVDQDKWENFQIHPWAKTRPRKQPLRGHSERPAKEAEKRRRQTELRQVGSALQEKSPTSRVLRGHFEGIWCVLKSLKGLFYGERGESEIMDHYDGPTVLQCNPMSSLNDTITFSRDWDNCFGCVKYFWNFKIDSY